MGHWSGAGSHWTYIPGPEGDENPNFPPKVVQEQAVRGPDYASSDGKTYRTWLVPAPTHEGQVHTMFNQDAPAGTLQQVVDWSVEPEKK